MILDTFFKEDAKLLQHPRLATNLEIISIFKKIYVKWQHLLKNLKYQNLRINKLNYNLRIKMNRVLDMCNEGAVDYLKSIIMIKKN